MTDQPHIPEDSSGQNASQNTTDSFNTPAQSQNSQGNESPQQPNQQQQPPQGQVPPNQPWQQQSQQQGWQQPQQNQSPQQPSQQQLQQQPQQPNQQQQPPQPQQQPQRQNGQNQQNSDGWNIGGFGNIDPNAKLTTVNRVVWFCVGFLGGLFGVLAAWIFCMAMPPGIRKQIYNMVWLGFFSEVVIMLILFGATGNTDTSSLFGGSAGTNTADTSSTSSAWG